MKKLFLSLVATIVAATATFAQSSLLATLSHEGNITTYYGTTALKEAVTAAADGDIVTLSSGSFAATDINKAITLRGAGMAADSALRAQPTVINGDFKIDIPTGTTHKLTMEGICHKYTIWVVDTLQNATFLKCRLNSFTNNNANSRMKDLTFLHCKIAQSLQIPVQSSVSCVNSVVCYPYAVGSSASQNSNFEFSNCILIPQYISYVGICSMKNCIVTSKNSSSYVVPSGASVYYSLGTGIRNDPFRDHTNGTNNVEADITQVFKTWTGDYTDSETFELTDAAKAKYLGEDGTQIGIYGGNMPFDPTPTNPQITKCQVAAKSTADGKLSVEIEVNAAY